MKKLFAALCALALLTSCEAQIPPAPTPTATTTPTAAAPTPTPNPNGYPDIDALPPLPPYSPGEIYTRRYDNTVTDFIPADDYGEVYPFIGGVGSSPWAIVPYQFGFCTAAGEIVCDAVYGDVRLYEYGGESIYVFRKATDLVSDNWEGSGAPDAKMYFMPTDGSYITQYDEIRDGYEGTFAVCRDGKWGSVDFHGDEVLPLQYEYPMYFFDGLAVVTEDFSKGYKYVDRQNNIVVPDMPPVPEEQIARRDMSPGDDEIYTLLWQMSFYEGRAVFFDGDFFGYIGLDGEVAIPARFDAIHGWPGEFRGGYATLYIEGNDPTYIDPDGAVIPESDITPPPGEYSPYTVYNVLPEGYTREPEYDYDGGAYSVMRPDGTYLLSEYSGIYCYGGKYAVRSARYAGLVDGDGRWLVKLYLPAVTAD